MLPQGAQPQARVRIILKEMWQPFPWASGDRARNCRPDSPDKGLPPNRRGLSMESYPLSCLMEAARPFSETCTSMLSPGLILPILVVRLSTWTRTSFPVSCFTT